MTEKKVNWFIEARKSEDEDVRVLLESFIKADKTDKKKKEKIKREIEIKLGLVDAEKLKKEKEEIKNKSERFTYIESDIDKIDDVKELDKVSKICKERINSLEKTRLKNETFKDRKELKAKIWEVKLILYKARKKIIDIKTQKELETKKNKVSNLDMKRARFINLIRQNYSISNIIKDENGVRKEELLNIVNDDVIEVCSQIDSNFIETFNRWIVKFGLKKG